MALKLLKELNEHGVSVHILDGKLKVQSTKKDISQQLITKIKANKEELLDFLRAGEMDSTSSGEITRVSDNRDSFPLSFGQQSLWFMSQFEHESGQYNMASAFILKGDLDQGAMQKALDQIIQRHEILRTNFTAEGRDGPVQIVKESASLPIEKIDLSAIDVGQQGFEVERLREEEAYRVFDLTKDLMVRVTLIMLDAQQHVVLFTMHHIASDGGSFELLISEFVMLYSAFSAGHPNPLPPLDVQYGDFATWQRSSTNEEKFQQQLEYWQSKLADAPSIHGLPLDRPRPAQQAYEGGAHVQTIAKDLSDKVRQLGEKNDASLFMVLQAALALLVGKWSNETDVLIGSPMSARNRKELSPLIGYFVNTLVYRTKFEQTQDFASLLVQGRQNALEAYDNQAVPFEMIVDHLKIERDFSHTPLHQIVLSLASTDASTVELPGLRLENFVDGMDRAKVDLEITVGESDDGLRLHWLYATSLFDEKTIVRLAESFNVLLDQVIRYPNMQLGKLVMVPSSEQNFLTLLNETDVSYDEYHCLHELFEITASDNPTRTALIFDDVEYSYQQLDHAANQLAHYLVEQGVSIGDLVGIGMDRSPNMMISILAVLKSGAAYLPLDPNYPAERVQFMVRDSGISIVLTSRRLSGEFADANNNVHVISIDAAPVKAAIAEHPVDVPLRRHDGLDASTTAYMIYTSGSTGQPKGVMISHNSATNYIQYAATTYLSEGIVGSVVSSTLVFDATITTLFAPLLVGKSVELLPDDDRVLELLADYLSDDDERLLFKITPAHLDALAPLMSDQGCAAAHKIVVGGEQLTKRCLTPWRQVLLPNATFINEYGPTETVVGCSVYTIRPDTELLSENIPIGKSIANVQLYVLNSSMTEQCIGAVGELYIGGAGLAKGYLNRAELTKDRFVSSPLSDNTKLYRTGDLVRRLDDGNLEFIGRVDDQVKVRGFRVELGEIETCLRQLESVNECIVVCDQAGDENRLLAYVVPVGSVTDGDLTSNLNTALKGSLPDYMVPSYITILDSLPLTGNGKVDKKRLPAPGHHSAMAEYIAPKSRIELALVNIWQRLLDVERVGSNTDFFEIGGNSLSATRVVSAVNQEFDKKLAVRAVFEHRTISALAAHIDTLLEGNFNEMIVVPRDQALSLSFSQQRLWFIDQLDQGATQYVMPARLNLQGALDIGALQYALDQIFIRHETLRTTFTEINGKAIQQIHRVDRFPLSQIDLSDLDDENRAEQLENHGREEADKAFDLAEDFPLRVTLVKLQDESHELFFTMHHIASDGWSTSIWTREFVTLYQAFVEGRPNPLPELKYQFVDYAHWQLRILDDEHFLQKMEYWKEQLVGIPSVHSLPLDRTRPSDQNFSGNTHVSYVDAEMLDQIKHLAAKSNASLYMFLETTFALLIGRWSNQHDIVIGSPVAGRTHKEIEPLIGFFANNLVIRTELSEAPKYSELLRANQNSVIDALDNQDVPFDMLVDALQVERSLTHAPVFQLVFDLQNNEQADLSIPGLVICDTSDENRVANYDLELHALETQDGVRFNWIFADSLFDIATIETMARSFEVLLKGILAAPDCPINEYPILDPIDQLANFNWNQTKSDYPRQECVHTLFEASVARHPKKIAVEDDAGNKISYEEINGQANQLAYYLLKNGVNKGDIIALCIDRGIDMLIGMLGIVKSGAAYLPIDPNYPAARIEYLLENSATKFVVTNQELMSTLPLLDQRVLPIDEPMRALLLSGFSEDNVSPDVVERDSSSIAYVIYTSGSTGEPVGVMNSHKALSNLVHWHKRYYEVDEHAKASHLASVGFDAAVWEVWPYLICGAQLFSIDDSTRDNPKQLLEVLERNQISHCFLPTGLLELMIDFGLLEHEGLRYLLTGGDKLSVRPNFENAKLRIINNYGPTEAAVVTTCHTIDPSQSDRETPIGKPIDNAKVFILDENFNELPAGVVGELYIGGEGLAEGYLNNPELTRQRFLEGGLIDECYGRLYRTGDLARRLSSGDLEFAGRVDDQVKIRGFRIELGEVERHVNQCVGVFAALVIVSEDSSGDKKLVCHLIPDEQHVNESDHLIESIRQNLRKHLPEYMTPSAFVVLESWPLTANGKIDRKKLPPPDWTQMQGEYLAPETDTEISLVSIWAELLGIEADGISTSADFFDLGGHSLLAIRLVAQIRDKLLREVVVKIIFEQPDIRGLAAYIDSLTTVSIRPAVTKVDRNTPTLTPSFAQQRLWFIDQLDGGSAQYNISAALRVEGEFKVDASEQAISRIIERHEPLRTVFVAEDGQPEQLILKEFKFELIRHDLTELTPDEQDQNIRQLASADTLRAFDLSQDLMLRVSYLQLSQGDSGAGVLLFNMHHIASDGWSMGLLVAEFVQQYQAIIDGQPDPLEPLLIQYADYAYWQRESLADEVFEQQLGYWKQQLREVPVTHGLPLEFARSEQTVKSAAIVNGCLDAKLSGRLQEFAKAHGMTPFMLLHAALSLVISRHSNSQDIVIGTPVANRTQAELESLIGFFVNTLVLRVDTNHDLLSDYLAHVRDVNLDAQMNQDVPFEHLVEHCKVPRSNQHSPLFQIMFMMNTIEENELELPGVRFSRVDTDEIIAQFDLDVTARVTEDGVYFNWVYDKGLFSGEYIQQLNDHLLRLITGLIGGSISKLAELPLLSSTEQQELICTFNNNQQEELLTTPWTTLFERQAALTPNSIAVRCASETISYSALEASSRQLAAALKENGIGKESKVALLAERGIELLINIVAVLRSGAAYIPLDPAYPAERLRLILEESEPEMVLLSDQFLDVLGSEYDSSQIFTAEQILNGFSADGIELSPPSMHDLAYIIFTSGSTGRPKGVMIEHLGMINNMLSKVVPLQLTEQTIIAQTASQSFDISVWQFLTAIVLGGVTDIVPSSITGDPDRLQEYLSKHQVHIWEPVPSMIQAVLFDPIPLPSLKCVLPTGEALTPELVNMWFDVHPQTPLFNAYGPAECSDDVTIEKIDTKVVRVSLGGPVANARIHIVDHQQQLVPIGVIGEIAISGPVVGRGYVGQPELTADVFIDNPYCQDSSDRRMYLSGDLGRRNGDGKIEYVGRKDHQVKVRGLRIELGEIESNLRNYPDVAEAVVIAKAQGRADANLNAFLVLSEQNTYNQEALRTALLDKLPPYMVPHRFTILSEMPLNANGKIDRNALAQLNSDGVLESFHEAPVTETEVALVSIWSELLNMEVDKVSVSSNFFELGGHSLLVVRVISKIRNQLQREVAVKSIFDHPDIRGLAAEIDGQVIGQTRMSVVKIERNSDNLIPSFAQQRLWFIDRLGEGSAEYNMPTALRIKGEFDVDAAEQAITRIIQRHEPLRTIFVEEDGQPTQLIRREFTFRLVRNDLSEFDDSEQDKRVKEMFAEDGKQLFDLSRDLMVRASFLQLSQGPSSEGVLLFNMHHIASDGWSIGLLVTEFIQQYQAITEGQPDPLEPLSIQYADYAHWQREWMAGDVMEEQLRYWQLQLEEAPVTHGIPLDFPRSEQAVRAAGVVEGHLNSEHSDRLFEVARAHEMTPFMLLHAALSLVISRQSNSPDIVIGTPVANRTQAELESLIGFFVNTLVLRVDTEHDLLSDYLAYVREVNLDAQSNQDVPFEHLVELCNVPRNIQHSPLFQIMFTMDTNDDADLELDGVQFSSIDPEKLSAKFDLNISARLSEQGIEFSWVYDSSLFKPESVARLNQHLLYLLQNIADVEDAELSGFARVPDAEYAHLVNELNNTQVAISDNRLLHEIFESQVEENANQDAVVYQDEKLSYQQLNQESNRLAHYIVGLNLHGKTRIGICLEHSIELMVAILGVMKSGCSYVVLQPGLSNERMSYFVEDSGLRVMVSSVKQDNQLRFEEVETLLLDGVSSEVLADLSDDNLTLNLKSSEEQYVLYTSGSSGKPKGVMVCHDSVMDYCQFAKRHYYDDATGSLLVTSPAFDISVPSLFLPLICGDTLKLMDREDPLSALVATLMQASVNDKWLLRMTPMHVQALLSLLPESDLLASHIFVIGGEDLTVELAVQLQNRFPHSQIFNHYGPTETTVGCSIFDFTSNQKDIRVRVPIGRPMDNTQLFVLDADNNILPYGAIGELCVGGSGVSRGYLNRPELTEEKFIANPFSKDEQNCLYKTGDLVRYLEDGNLEFLGRIDEQVKVRGFRIELGEIEYHLNLSELISSSLLMVKEGVGGEKNLIAYVIKSSASELSDQQLVQQLRYQLQIALPSYMVPSMMVVLDEWPLSANGKTDKQALPEPDGTVLQLEYLAPESDTEKVLTQIWATLLGLDQDKLSVSANFFDLGGHSLLVIKLISDIQAHYGLRLDIRQIFMHGTVRSLAPMLDRMILEDSLNQLDEGDVEEVSI